MLPMGRSLTFSLTGGCVEAGQAMSPDFDQQHLSPIIITGHKPLHLHPPLSNEGLQLTQPCTFILSEDETVEDGT